QAELHFIRARLQGGKRNKAQRGELRFPLPVGLTHDDQGHIALDPDEERSRERCDSCSPPSGEPVVPMLLCTNLPNRDSASQSVLMVEHGVGNSFGELSATLGYSIS